MTGARSFAGSTPAVGSSSMSRFVLKVGIGICQTSEVRGSGTRVEIDQQPVVPRVGLQLCHSTVRIVEIAEDDGLCRTGGLARGHNLAVSQWPIFLLRLNLRRIDPLHTVG